MLYGMTNPIPFFILFLSVSCSSQLQSENTDWPDRSFGQTVDSLPSSVWALFEDQNGHFWFGSNGQGVFHQHDSGITQYTVVDGLASNQIRGIKGDDQGRVLFDTPGGVSMFNSDRITTLMAKLPSESQWMLGENDLWFQGSGNINGT
ncbi:MAG: hypothetical protein HKN32_02830, partial [Flavobacteriales bacterium]|nr:hypothetical protein [Flavobacteriales bacterium]